MANTEKANALPPPTREYDQKDLGLAFLRRRLFLL